MAHPVCEGKATERVNGAEIECKKPPCISQSINSICAIDSSSIHSNPHDTNASLFLTDAEKNESHG